MGRNPLSRRDLLLWAAGYIDGEGWVRIKRTSRTVQVKSVCPYSLWRLQALFGGSVYVKRYRPSKRSHLPEVCFIFQWAVFGETAASVCKELSDLGVLTVKPAQARAVAFGKKMFGTATYKRLMRDADNERYRRYNCDKTPRW